jgi:tryptophan-rich sensory protein
MMPAMASDAEHVEAGFRREHPIIGLIGFLLLSFSAAAIGNLATSSSVDGWYQTIQTPSWGPPNWVFGPVWTVLYITIGVAGWLVWRRRRWTQMRVAMLWFAAQLVLNALWSLIFFGLQAPGWAATEIVVLWIAVGGTVITFWRHSAWASVLLLPYWAWVTFAAALNFAIWRMNQG